MMLCLEISQGLPISLTLIVSWVKKESLTFIIHDMSCLLVIERVDDLVVAIVLVSI